MVTGIETERDKNGEQVPVRVYHRAGTIDGRKDEKFAWTHKFEERAECEACQNETIPSWVKSSPQ